MCALLHPVDVRESERVCVCGVSHPTQWTPERECSVWGVGAHGGGVHRVVFAPHAPALVATCGADGLARVCTQHSAQIGSWCLLLLVVYCLLLILEFRFDFDLIFVPFLLLFL